MLRNFFPVNRTKIPAKPIFRRHANVLVSRVTPWVSTRRLLGFDVQDSFPSSSFVHFSPSSSFVLFSPSSSFCSLLPFEFFHSSPIRVLSLTSPHRVLSLTSPHRVLSLVSPHRVLSSSSSLFTTTTGCLFVSGVSTVSVNMIFDTV